MVHLAQADTVEVDGATGSVAGDGRLAQRVLEAAAAVDARHLVLLSSAVAYGAWANNPVPLTEDAPLRPNPGVAFAAEKAEVERAAADWRDDHPGATVAVLRPTLVVASEGNGWLARALGPLGRCPSPRTSPRPSSSTSTTSPPRWTWPASPTSTVPATSPPTAGWTARPARALAGAPRVRLPERVAIRVAGWRWRFGHGRHPARAAALHRAPVGHRQRPAARRRLGADLLERGGLRRHPRGWPAGHHQPPTPPGDRPRRHRCGPRRRHRRDRGAGPPPRRRAR